MISGMANILDFIMQWAHDLITSEHSAARASRERKGKADNKSRKRI